MLLLPPVLLIPLLLLFLLFLLLPLLLTILVSTERLELSRLSPPPPQDGVSTNSTTSTYPLLFTSTGCRNASGR